MNTAFITFEDDLKKIRLIPTITSTIPRKDFRKSLRKSIMRKIPKIIKAIPTIAKIILFI